MQVGVEDEVAHAVRQNEERQIWAGLSEQGCDLTVHLADRKPRDSRPTTIAISFEVDQMDQEAIKGELESHLKEHILALAEAVEHGDLAAVLAFIDVSDHRVVSVIRAVLGISDVLSLETQLLRENEFTFVKCLKHIKSLFEPVYVECM